MIPRPVFERWGDGADQVLGHPREPSSQGFTLGSHADRAVVGVADACHHTSDCDHRNRPEPELVGAKRGHRHDVPPGPHPAVHTHHHPLSQLICRQALRQPRNIPSASFPITTYIGIILHIRCFMRKSKTHPPTVALGNFTQRMGCSSCYNAVLPDVKLLLLHCSSCYNAVLLDIILLIQLFS